jgi:hypothetical protein
MTSSKTTDFCDANNIEWFPINLTIDGKKKTLEKINHKLYNFIRPDLHDFSDMDLIRARQHLYKTQPELFTHLCVNTKKVYHIDIDTDDYSQGFDNLMYHSPYFKSMTKSYGRHIFIRVEDTFIPESTRMQFKNDDKGGVELLCGGGSYAPFEMINADKEIMVFTTESMKTLLVIEERRPKSPNSVVSTNSVASINTDKMLELGGIIKMDKINNYKDWIKIVWALRSESEQYKEVAREISKLSKTTKHPYTKYDEEGFEKAWDDYKSDSISIGTFYHYCKESNEKKYKAIIEKYTPKPEVKLPDGRDYESVKRKFEETHLLISNKGLFIRQTEDDNILMSKTHLITANERISYDVVVKDEVKSKCFIHDWLKDDQNRMKYDMAVYPPDTQCPDSVYNLWRPFTMETIQLASKNEEAITMIKNHIKIMSGNNNIVANYFELWIAQMIQFPSVKSICPTLISDEGAGKGTLMRLFEKMLGRDKILQTTKPSQTVWGNFNGLMKNAFLVNFDELSKKEGEGADGFIKGLITEPRITINDKGINPYELSSFHRFIITTNNEDPIKTSKRDRRKLIIRSSDELIGNREYFNKMYAMLDDDNAVKSIYEYFKTLPGADKFKDIPIPETEYSLHIKEAYTSPIELWVKNVTQQHIDEETVEMTASEQYDDFIQFKLDGGINFECSNVSFSLKLKNLKIDGVGETIHTRTGKKRVFEIEKLKGYFKIGCLL